ncbi:hypothetical protein NECAME_13943 [Necator americanus]|uniref:Uncharacterized protein n=1 Tax=Necator americanus TaxID=51031 RepID=W2STM6_NECAM|nr:hypothetical protein NECAME_13943 [Necator americanus]ETN72196.1 hypothetical protein NECAME_13943 [Necator americanus]
MGTCAANLEIRLRGPLLLSDVDRVRRRLKEIARNLSVMRETRLNLTTEDYFRSLVNVEAESQHDHSTMLAVRNRLNNISLTTFEPIVAPTPERIALMKYEEERDKRFAEISPPSAPSTVGQPATAYKKTIGLFPQRNNSDTDDDIGIPGGLTSILQNQPFKPTTEPTVHQSSVGILSQYLAAASTKTKDTTPSDSDDDFFK